MSAYDTCGKIADKLIYADYAGVIFDALSPESILSRKKAGLLTCFLHAVFPLFGSDP